MAPSRDEFARWRDDPVTRWVITTFEEMAAANKDAWVSASWDGNAANPLLLKELKVRADAYLALADMTYDTVVKPGEEPRD